MARLRWENFLKQVGHKPGKLTKVLKHNKPKERKFKVIKCKICGRYGAGTSAYGLEICKFCFAEFAKEMGWKKTGER